MCKQVCDRPCSSFQSVGVNVIHCEEEKNKKQNPNISSCFAGSQKWCLKYWRKEVLVWFSGAPPVWKLKWSQCAVSVISEGNKSSREEHLPLFRMKPVQDLWWCRTLGPLHRSDENVLEVLHYSCISAQNLHMDDKWWNSCSHCSHAFQKISFPSSKA